MKLHSVDATKDPNIRRQVRDLYLRAFPNEERLPWWVLFLNSCRRDIDLTAWLDGDRFCGFTASATVEGLHFLLFFAVTEDCRSQGYGSAILQAIQAQHPAVVLNTPSSPVPGILQATILEWVAISSSRGSCQPRDQTLVVFCLLHWQVGSLPLVPPGKPYIFILISN